MIELRETDATPRRVDLSGSIMTDVLPDPEKPYAGVSSKPDTGGRPGSNVTMMMRMVFGVACAGAPVGHAAERIGPSHMTHGTSAALVRGCGPTDRWRRPVATKFAGQQRTATDAPAHPGTPSPLAPGQWPHGGDGVGIGGRLRQRRE